VTRRRRPRAVYARVPGHALAREGLPHDDQGRPDYSAGWTGGEGRALCSCGASSQVMASGHARQQWHREHKADVS
jgi:hypothetical protein